MTKERKAITRTLWDELKWLAGDPERELNLEYKDGKALVLTIEALEKRLREATLLLSQAGFTDNWNEAVDRFLASEEWDNE
jgi:hypothetical protein